MQKLRQYREDVAAKAHAAVGEYLLPRIAGLVDGHRRIVDQPPLVFPPSPTPIHQNWCTKTAF